MNSRDSIGRVKLVWHDYTRWQKFQVWFWRVWIAITDELPTKYSQQVLLKPGDPGYDEAPLEVTLDPCPIRFKFKEDGSVQRMEDEDAGT